VITLRVADPAQALRFYRDVLGFSATLESTEGARVSLPGLVLALVRDRKLDALHGPGAARHRPGVGVEIHVPVPDAAEVARKVRERGGFVVAEEPGCVSVRDADGYVLTFETGV
jgi:catechol 2,3-dioxygenase-like lactoylglutathione lyase family enzyme